MEIFDRIICRNKSINHIVCVQIENKAAKYYYANLSIFSLLTGVIFVMAFVFVLWCMILMIDAIFPVFVPYN